MGFCRPVWCLCFPRKFLKVQCLESGQWEEGHCVPVVCKPPPPVFEGMYNCTRGFELDSQCVLNCEQQGPQVSGWGEANVDHTLCFRASGKRRAPCALLCRGVLQQSDPSPRPNTLVPPQSRPSTSPKLFLLGPIDGTRCTVAWGCSPAPWGPCLESSGPEQAGSSWVKRVRKHKQGVSSGFWESIHLGLWAPCCSSCAHHGASLGVEAAACPALPPGLSDECLERVSSKEVRLIPSGGIQQQLEHNWLSGQCTWAGPDGCNPAASGSFSLDMGGVSLHGAPPEMGSGQAGPVMPAALPLLCRFPSSALRRARGQRSSDCVRACRAPAHHPRS